MAEITKLYGGRVEIEFHPDGHYYLVNVPELDIYDLPQPSVTGIIGQHDKSGALVHWATECMEIYTLKALEAMPDMVPKAKIASLIARARKYYRQVKDEKAAVGSVVHRVLEQELLARGGQGDHPKLPLTVDTILAPELTAEIIDQANNSISAGLQFFDEHKIEVVQTEAIRWSPKHGYLGTGDLIAKFDGLLAMLDYKSGKRIYPSVWLQLAAYQKAWEEEHPDQPLSLRVAVNVGRDGALSHQVRTNSDVDKDFAGFLGLLRIWRWNEENKEYKPRKAPQIVGALP